MGVINVTPDSFADAGRRLDPARAVEDACLMVEQGADLIDVGAESTRPGAEPLPARDELDRLLPVLRGLQGRLAVPLSVDTYKAEVATAALDCGAAIINDVSALAYEPALAQVVARRGAALILMHHRGRSASMYERARYADVPLEVAAELVRAQRLAEAAGVATDRIIFDPGLGFAKRPEHSWAALATLPRLVALGRPLLVGPSRKSFLASVIGETPPDRRDWATAAAVTAAVLLGAHLVRVHAVPEMIQAVRVADRLRSALEASAAGFRGETAQA